MYKKGFEGWRKHLDFMIIDMFCIHVSIIIAYFCRHGWALSYVNSVYPELSVLMTVMDWIVAFFFNSFKNVLKRGYYKEFLATVKHVFLLLMILTFYLFSLKKGEEYSRIIIYLFAFFYFVISYVVRLLWKKYLLEHGFQKQLRSTLIVAESDRVREVLKTLREYKGDRFQFSGIVLVDDQSGEKEIEGVPVVADVENAAEYACREWVDEVFVQFSNRTQDLEKMMQQFLEMGVTVHQELGKRESGTQKQFVEKLGDYVVLTTSINYASPQQVFMKRLMDIIGGIIGCICTLLIYIVIAPLIKKESPGPVFFSQVRIGKNGRKFKIYKFRSMYMDAEERKRELMEQNRIKDGFMFKLEYDPRIIGSKKLPDGTVKRGIGNIIRDYSLDEFPQFYNVLKGDMSLVGTRPPTVDEWEKYELHHRVRLATKPGITGMWQVSGRSNIVDFEEVVKLDKKYITEWSMGLDLKILMKTVTSVLKKEGSM
ncbi:MAG: sugar transferase [Lachnospiraceae bacterium]